MYVHCIYNYTAVIVSIALSPPPHTHSHPPTHTDPPVFTVGAFFEGNEGDALRINLSVDGNPLPLDSFSWTYDGQPLSAETGRLVFGAEFIEFTPLQRTDRGRYMITGSNLAGNGSAFFDLEVYCELLRLIYSINILIMNTECPL